MKRIALVFSQPPEASIIRFSKVIPVLQRGGNQVAIFYWDRDIGIQQERYLYGCNGIRFKLKVPSGLASTIFLPAWWLFVFCQLFVRKWDAVHAVNFDSLIPSLFAARIKRKRILYEITDVYADSIQLPEIVRVIGTKIEKMLAQLTDGVIVIDEAQIAELGGINNSQVVAVYDTPPESDILTATSQRENNIFTIYCGGFFRKDRSPNLDELFAAVKGTNGVKLSISGYGDLVEYIEEASAEAPDKIEYLGFISHEQVLQRTLVADLLVVTRTSVIRNNRYNCGSNFLRSMMCGRPFLAFSGTATADKVIEDDCGLVVDAYNIEAIRAAIVKLRDDPELCRKMGENAQKAYELKYRWEVMEQRLADLYQQVVV